MIRRFRAPLLAAATAVALRAGAAGASPPAEPDASVPDPAAEILRERLEQWETAGRLEVSGADLVSLRALPRLYETNGYRRFWTPDRLDVLRKLVDDSAADGLTPEDYHRDALARVAAPGGADPRTEANVDLLATDAFVLLLRHLYLGKVDPRSLDPQWNFELRPIVEGDAIAFVSNALTRGLLAEAVDEARPKHWWYQKARASLAEYRALAERGGWPAIPAGPALKTGAKGARVQALRRRLAATGDLASGQPLDRDVFDEPLAEAVRVFQSRHRLGADGAVGPGTLAELNVPVEARILQIRINLERARWVLHEVEADHFVLVDVAGFEVAYVRDRETAWRGRIQIGKPYRQTPIFKSRIDHVVFNPTWTVPPGILGKDVLPAMRKDPGYLAAKKLEVLDRNGKPVDPSSIDWSKASVRNFPYMLRQGPGPENALGRVKIMFPNPYFVYLHDTPSKSLFEKDERAFSSGCIRVENPLELAALLLDDPKTWNAESIARVIEAGATRTVRLARPANVFLMYWTIVPSDDGHTAFKRDPYRRDPPLEAALLARFQPGSGPAR
jgi:murein L,D-transpeptidase YcbB/YkuD